MKVLYTTKAICEQIQQHEQHPVILRDEVLFSLSYTDVFPEPLPKPVDPGMLRNRIIMFVSAAYVPYTDEAYARYPNN